MSLNTLPLCYCTNVHSWQSLPAIVEGIGTVTAEVARMAGRPLSAGLWFSDPVSRELDGDEVAMETLSAALADHHLTCHTLNAFPQGDFHARRVKERVYLPDWSDRRRLDYTLRCARSLAALMPEAREGSISSMPLGFALADNPPDFHSNCSGNLCELARQLDQLHSETGRMIRLAIEPEPFCHLETTAGAVGFFEKLRAHAESEGLADLVTEHIGLCYDICHQAVEFEEPAASIASLAEAGIRINKVQISSAIELADPSMNVAGRAALAEFVEPRYLHQTFARAGEGILKQLDLTLALCEQPPREFLEAEAWRIHFHVPVNEEELGPLGTTRRQIAPALAAIGELEYAPHLEVETYTWSVLPGGNKPPLAAGLAKELTATADLIEGL